MGENDKKMLVNPPKKVVSMYQAVVDLINEEVNINTMKVSDITSRAGIGKGTAYEYFSSKEEIIAKALIFEMLKWEEQLREIAESNCKFRDKIMGILDLITSNFHENRTFCELFKVGMGAYDILGSLHEEFMKEQNVFDSDIFLRFNESIMKQGMKEGVIQNEQLSLCRTALNSQIIGYSLYLLSKKKGKIVNLCEEDAKEFAYQSLVKSLN